MMTGFYSTFLVYYFTYNINCYSALRVTLKNIPRGVFFNVIQAIHCDNDFIFHLISRGTNIHIPLQKLYPWGTNNCFPAKIHIFPPKLITWPLSANRRTVFGSYDILAGKQLLIPRNIIFAGVYEYLFPYWQPISFGDPAQVDNNVSYTPRSDQFNCHFRRWLSNRKFKLSCWLDSDSSLWSEIR